MKNEKLTIRFLRNPPDGLEDADLLELLLQFTSEQPKELAKRLMTQYPNLAAVIQADQSDLAVIEGMDDDSFFLLRLVPELNRRYFLSQSHPNAFLIDASDYGRYLLPYFYGARDEMVYLLTLDGAAKVIHCRQIGQGSVNSANVPMRRLVQEAINMNASSIVLAHNHPSGIAIPSKEDIEFTLRLQEALSILDISLLDHLIIADDDFVSLRESGYLC